MINLSYQTHSDQLNLEFLAREMLQYATRECPRIDQRTSLQKNKLIDQVNDRFQRENAIIRSIGLQLNQLLMQQANKRQALQDTIDELNQQMQQKAIDMENLQQAATHLESKVANYRDQYIKLKQFLQNLAQNHKQAQKLWKAEKKSLQNQFISLKQTVTKSNQLICKLSSEKELILAQFQLQRTNNQRLKHEINQFQLTLQKQKETIRHQQLKVTQLSKQRDKLLAQHESSEQALQNVKKDVQFLKYGLSFKKNSSERPQKISRHYSGPNISISKIKKIYWQECQNLPYDFLNPIDWQRGNPENSNDLRNVHPSLRCLSLDPYFAHFVLTSQSVKIKQDCEQLLNIDVKPYYNEIVQKKIPMHLWDQWIRNRLRQLRRKIRKPANELTSEDDHSM